MKPLFQRHAPTAFALASVALCAGCRDVSETAMTQQSITCDEQGPPQELTFRRQLRSKLFIDRIALSQCGPEGVVVPDPMEPEVTASMAAAYLAFCKFTDINYREHPENGNEDPLDARILAVVAVNWTCRAHQSVPVSGMVIRSNEIGGREAGPFYGLPDVTRTRETIAQNGEFSYVVSGKPNPVLEHSFTVFNPAGGPRTHPHIWHRVKGKITCLTDSNGYITTKLEARFDEATKFPSHRLWEYRQLPPGQGSVLVKQHASIPQGDFSNLWHLKAVGEP